MQLTTRRWGKAQAREAGRLADAILAGRRRRLIYETILLAVGVGACAALDAPLILGIAFVAWWTAGVIHRELTGVLCRRWIATTPVGAPVAVPPPPPRWTSFSAFLGIRVERPGPPGAVSGPAVEVSVGPRRRNVRA